MKETKNWDESYLLNLPVGEFDWLEAKGRGGLDLTLSRVREPHVRRNLSKAVSAFANSGGGRIVFGLSNPEDSWQVDDGGIDLAMRRPSTREWLEDILPTLVDLPLMSFNVYAIQRSSDESEIAPGRGVFVIEIPDSEQAPHQAVDNKYYARVGGKSRPIGHRLVADIFGRRRDPKVDLEFRIESSTHIPEFGISGRPRKRERKVELIVKARNVGRVYASYVNGFLYIPVLLVPYAEHRLQYADLEDIDSAQYWVWYTDNTRRDVLKDGLFGPAQYGSSWFDPILPKLAHTWKWALPADFDAESLTDERILWKVHADNAPKSSGSILVREIEFTSKE